MVSVRVDVADIQRIHTLEKDGYYLMDTLVCYGGSLENLEGITPPPNGLVVRMASFSDKDAVSGAARKVFHRNIETQSRKVWLEKMASEEKVPLH